MNRIHSYSKIYNLGHREVVDIFQHWIVIQEKYDGSQISFGVFDGVLKIRSKNRELDLNCVPKMFELAVEQIRKVEEQLRPNWTFRGECISKPKHNTLTYERVPDGNIVLFDIDKSEERYIFPVINIASKLGFEPARCLYVGPGKCFNLMEIEELLKNESTLGGTTVEGIVIKAYGVYGKDKKTLMAKYVSEAFKEKHQNNWKKKNPGSKDIINNLSASLRTEARWNKAIQHLSEAGLLEGHPKDIGPLIREIIADVELEEGDYIADVLYKWAIPQIRRGVVRGFPEWYKKQLLEKQFEGESNESK